MNHKKKILGLFTTLIIFSVVFVLTNKNPISPDRELGMVTNVVDGDTLEVEINTIKQSVRLLGVDAAELEFGDNVRITKRECFSLEAKAELERLTLGKEVTLESDSLNENTDDYGRLLRYVYLSDGTLVNKILIENGFTRHLSFFPLTKSHLFTILQSTARSQNLGLWEVCPE